MAALVVFVGAGLGGVARYALSGWMQGAGGSSFPWATLIINVTGSLLLTFVYGLLDGAPGGAEWRTFLGIGLLGGYTTFSTFSLEAIRLFHSGDWERGLGYVVGSVALSLAGAMLGFRLASIVRS